MSGFNYKWLQGAIQTTGSVVPKILPRVIAFGVFGFFVYLFDHHGLPVSQVGIANIVPGIVLGLLLVFRTNTAYERFWEGRKLWGSIVNTTRNLSRKIWVFVEESTPIDRTHKIVILRLLVAFAVTTKLYLRQEPLNEEVRNLLSPTQYVTLQGIEHPPLEIVFWVNDYLNKQRQTGKIHIYEMISIVHLLNQLVDYLGSCERILRTPMPLAYSIHLKQLLLLYCLMLPFEIVSTMGWLTGIVSALTSFTLLGIEEIGVEIENPFGRDPNDLPLDSICDNLRRHVEDLITQSPGHYTWLDEPNISDLIEQ